ncbi:outer membrane receptor protein involved in Fe transport [Chitinophaga niastensis]|uniref:Outer membrane receptor protein involved in Fe transport n=1 Tax=Chitinophaga niastensis TaxID=536980 RepID=A0A2P8HNR2_CHINA|nr:outer membrane beta-barrel protein [Chitinophaga niastensis]PSL47852.1 outer membrane receptor protein involved in Fe transport [Chitinophaga niastensis]
MQKIYLFITLFLLSMSTQAQAPAGAGGPRMPMGNNGHIYGKVIDPDGKPVNYASVIILQNRMDTVAKKMKEVLLKGALTKGNGEFSLEELPGRGPLKLRITATGYKTYDQAVSFPPFDKDLGNIKLAVSTTQLQGVTVAGTKPIMQMDIDKKVFNVEKNIVSAGGTALDVMKNVPSVNVDIDGNVTLRNSAPQLYIDGRPTTLTLEQIPADAIENVEVITNPSAKYDASGGSAGILNIVLKKNRKTGYNGNLRAGVDKRGALNGGADFNLRQDKVNITASVMGNQMKGRTTGTTERNNFSDNPPTLINQDNANRTNGGFVFGKLGLDYFVSNRTTLSIAGIKVHGEMNPTEIIDINSDSLYKEGHRPGYSQRTSSSNNKFNANGLVLGMKHLFPKEGEELTADFNYFGGKSDNNSHYNTNHYNNNNIVGNDMQQILGGGSISFMTIQTDYVKPFANKLKLETGLRASIRDTKTNFNNYTYDHGKQDYVLIPAASNNYKNSDNVYAAYVSLSNTIHNFGYKVGLRAESSDYTGELINLKQHFKNSYPVSLFPSLFLSQKLKQQQELQISYTRRINRPNFFQLIPFTDSTDKLNITKGNPGLVPEFTQSVEMSYLKTFKGNNTFLASIYYKHTDNLITRYLTKETDPVSGSELLINTYINANSSYSTGAELTTMNTLTKWWTVTGNVNIYNSKINTSSVGQSQDAMWSWFGKANSTFKLPASFEIQLTGTYQSKTNLPVNDNKGGQGGPMMQQSQNASQGYIASFYGVDAAIKKSFLKNNAASVTLSVNDIFRSRKTDQYSESPYFTQYYSRLRDPQMIRLNFAYRFGKIDAGLFKRKNMGAGMQGMSEVIQ